jgi:hypothetical protein
VLDVATQAPGECDGRFLGSEVAQHVAGGGEADGVAAERSLVRDVAENHRFADAVGAEQDSVDAIVDEFEGKEVIDGLAIDALGPRPIVVGDGFEAADAGGAEASLEA